MLLEDRKTEIPSLALEEKKLTILGFVTKAGSTVALMSMKIPGSSVLRYIKVFVSPALYFTEVKNGYLLCCSDLICCLGKRHGFACQNARRLIVFGQVSVAPLRLSGLLSSV